MGKVVDVTSGVTLGEQIDEAASAWTRFRGLMLRGSLAEGAGLDIRPCGSIHMMFMRFAIDAVFYDREGRVTKVARRVRPWIGLAFGGKGAKGVIELPVGAADGVSPGDQLEFS
ncbi:MAG: DUF192 domain-containing protein [Hyphomicrobiales bacterium]